MNKNKKWTLEIRVYMYKLIKNKNYKYKSLKELYKLFSVDKVFIKELTNLLN